VEAFESRRDSSVASVGASERHKGSKGAFVDHTCSSVTSVAASERRRD